MIGAAIAAWVAGIVRDNVGDYAIGVRRGGLDRDRRRVRGAGHPSPAGGRPGTPPTGQSVDGAAA